MRPIAREAPIVREAMMILRDPKTEIRPSQLEESHDSTVVLSKAALNRYACPCPIAFSSWLGIHLAG